MASLTVFKALMVFSAVLLHIDVDAVTEPPPTKENNITTTHAPTATANTTANTTTHVPTTTAKTTGNTTTHVPTTTANTTANTTTHVPTTTANTTGNTTTHVPTTTANTTGNTTTHVPTTTANTTGNTTTHVPTTTANTTANTTTHVPTTTAKTTGNTTTHVPTTTANTTANTTTQAPLPTLQPKPSPPLTGNYSVKNDKETCIIATMGLELELVQVKQDKTYFNVIPKFTKPTGQCGENKANLKLEFSEGFINFVFVKDNHYYHIEEVTSIFKQTDVWKGNASNLSILKTDNGYCVKCKNTPTINLSESVNLLMTNVYLQAFDIQNGAFGKETRCSYDRNIIGLAVGLTVVILIIIGLIAYLIYHKRKSSGYQKI